MVAYGSHAARRGMDKDKIPRDDPKPRTQSYVCAPTARCAHPTAPYGAALASVRLLTNACRRGSAVVKPFELDCKKPRLLLAKACLVCEHVRRRSWRERVRSLIRMVFVASAAGWAWSPAIHRRSLRQSQAAIGGANRGARRWPTCREGGRSYVRAS